MSINWSDFQNSSVSECVSFGQRTRDCSSAKSFQKERIFAQIREFLAFAYKNLGFRVIALICTSAVQKLSKTSAFRRYHILPNLFSRSFLYGEFLYTKNWTQLSKKPTKLSFIFKTRSHLLSKTFSGHRLVLWENWSLTFFTYGP